MTVGEIEGRFKHNQNKPTSTIGGAQVRWRGTAAADQSFWRAKCARCGSNVQAGRAQLSNGNAEKERV